MAGRFTQLRKRLSFSPTNLIFSIRAGTKKSATNKDTNKLIITTAAKSCKSRRSFSSKKKMMTNAPTVVKVAAKMETNAFRLRRLRIWSVITMVLSMTKFSEMVIPAKEYSCISSPKA